MSEFVPTHGVFGISRRVWEDPDFSGDEPFSEREAWIWMISAAAWKPCEVRVGKAVVSVARGQFVHSLRFLADKWRWKKDRVRRFLKRLENRDSLRTETATGRTTVTICKYDKYQVAGLPRATATRQDCDSNATDARQRRDKEEEGKEREEGKEESGGAGAQPEYAFEGETVKLTAKDVAQWRKAYPHIVDLTAELQAADDYYTDNPPADGKWYFRVSSWLKRANNEAGEYDRWEEDYYRSVC